MIKKTNPGLKIICLNRKASINYFFEELIEAGIVLKGSEIKSIRDGNVSIADSYAVEKDGEIVLINSHIAAFKQANYSNHNPMDERKLLLNKKEINKLFDVSGKVVVVTGGSRGIGEMITSGFLANGAKVYISARKAPALMEKAKELSEKYNGECIAIQCDLSTLEGMY